MYGGLFGDLPSARKGEQDDSSNHKPNAPQNSSASPAVSVPLGNKKEDKKSVVSGLGNAGTSMAFVPVSIRQRKRPAPSSSAAAPPASIATPKTTKTKTTTTTIVPTKNRHQPKAPAETNIAANSIYDTTQATQVEVPTVVVTTTVVKKNHQTYNNKEEDEKDIHRQQQPSPLLMDESDELAKLHASVTDPYDPLVPNDLLAFLESKKQERTRLELEREARETLERQKRLREQLEQERQAIAATGDVEQLVKHREKHQMGLSSHDGTGEAALGRGRGRGRGVSNLPAWLVQKQKKEQQDDDALRSTPHPTTGTTVLLANLTAPGDVDEELGEEVQEECEEKCGKVISVKVQDAVLPHQPQVHVYVTFVDAQDAEQAAKVFHGRMFGQRSITARLAETPII
mmetsp:Transcript_21687/g.33413  ORF Transcript_21687/g.33413 Transcript_21687/m.33413 type:complete len:400 (+) Transcript_21687:51-1250(+)